MAEERDTVVLEKRGSAAWLFLSRPQRMNALSAASVRALWGHLSRIEADPGVRAMVLSGKGDAFCAGMEVAELERATPLEARRRSREIQMLTGRIAEMSLPTVAAVNGVAMGAGLEICLACDLVVASTRARFAFPEVRLGMIPCGGGTQRLARLVGMRRARELVLTGRVLTAEEAVRWGLINESVEPHELESKVDGLVEKLAMSGRMAVYLAKRCLNHSLDVDLGRGLEYESECFTTCFASGEPAAALRHYAGEGAPGDGRPEAALAGMQEERDQAATVPVGDEVGTGEEEAAAEGERGDDDDEEDEDIFA